MRIFEFIDKYCKDLVEEAKQKKQLIDLADLPHDGIEQDIEGAEIPVVYVDNMSIPVSDFLTMDRCDFVKIHTTPGAGEAYDNYVSALEIIEGAEALNHIRNAILAEAKVVNEAVDNFCTMI